MKKIFLGEINEMKLPVPDINKPRMSLKVSMRRNFEGGKALYSGSQGFDSDRGGWIELRPVGVTVGLVKTHPIFLLAADDNMTVPIWLSALDVDVLLARQMGHTGESMIDLFAKLLQAFDAQAVRLEMTELRGIRWGVQLVLSMNDGSSKSIKTTAAEALAMCLAQKVKIYIKPELIVQARQINLGDFQDLEKAEIESEIGTKKTSYMM